MTSNRGFVPWLQDADVTLYHGDVLEALRELPAESADCVVTSPPYWGLRDYGQEGQLGLEPTPEQYVERMVEVFREVRRVLAPHGTVWLNLGDSYASAPAGNTKPRAEGGNGAGRFDVHGGAGQDHYFENKARAGGKDKQWREMGLKPKDLVGIPWRVAFALQADGWYLRSDIIWSKPNPMPESVTDRPTKAHEYVFLLSKQPRYFFDQEAVREMYAPASEERYRYAFGGPKSEALTAAEKNGPGTRTHPIGMREYKGPKGPDGRKQTTVQGADGSIQHRDGERWPNGGRNIRSVWEIATQPYPEAHFATFPEELARRCIAAGCPEQVCRVCGKARERIVESVGTYGERKALGYDKPANMRVGEHEGSHRVIHPPGMDRDLTPKRFDRGWSDCGHDNYRLGIVLDPFIGSGTVAHVARKLGRHAVGIDLNDSYLELAARRLQQQSLFAEPAA